MNIEEVLLLSRVDDLSIFQRYIPNVQIGRAIRSPFRNDQNPSFGIFVPKEEPRENFFSTGFSLIYYDYSMGIAGDCIDLVKRLYSLTRKEALSKVLSDFLNGIVPKLPELNIHTRLANKDNAKSNISISKKQFSQRGLKFWNDLGISIETLIKYKVFELDAYRINQYKFYPKDLTFGYEELGGYQIYRPFSSEKKYKFRNNLDYDFLFGYEQLPETGDCLIIDKSKKDLLYCHSVLHIPAIAPKSETSKISDEILENLQSRFKNIYLMFDNDPTGIKYARKYFEKHTNIIPIFLPFSKDKTDLCKEVGIEKSKEYILQLLTSKKTIHYVKRNNYYPLNSSNRSTF